MAGGNKRIRRLTQNQTDELMWYLRAVDIATEDMPDGAWAANLQNSAVQWLENAGLVDPYHDDGYTIVYDFYIDWRMKMSEQHSFFEIGD